MRTDILFLGVLFVDAVADDAQSHILKLFFLVEALRFELRLPFPNKFVIGVSLMKLRSSARAHLLTVHLKRRHGGNLSKSCTVF